MFYKIELVYISDLEFIFQNSSLFIAIQKMGRRKMKNLKLQNRLVRNPVPWEKVLQVLSQHQSLMVNLHPEKLLRYEITGVL